MTQITDRHLRSDRFDLPGVEAALRATDGSALLLPKWLVQKYIACDRELGASPFQLPHGEIHVIQRRRMLELTVQEHLPLGVELPPSPTLILLVRPEADWLATTPADQVLRRYWRMLFHARIDLDLQRHLRIGHAAAGGDAPGERGRVQERIERVGRREFNEARFVLQREHYLFVTADDREAYVEFAAVYLELFHFAAPLLSVFFPSIDDSGEILRLLAQDVDSRSLLRQTRLEGAAEESDAWPDPAEQEAVEIERDMDRLPVTSGKQRAQDARAVRAAAAGNVVRAAILHTRAHGPNAAAPDLDSLVQRLQAALEFDDSTRDRWRAALASLLPRAAHGWWNPERRLLYDLQKVCVDHEREVYSVGVVQWLLERRRRPLVRAQPRQRMVLVRKHLRLALNRLSSSRLTPEQRSSLSELLHPAIHSAEERLRRYLRPSLVGSLEDSGVLPHNAVERIAEQKLIEELLDTLVRTGFLSFGIVRDVLSRNQIKLHDLSHGDLHRRHETGNGVVDFDPKPPGFSGRDQLLRINHHLRDSLDGVYRAGEIYLRFFQLASSLFFATRLGRFITRTVLLPFGGAIIILLFLEHLIVLVCHLPKETHLHLDHWIPWLGLGFFLLGVINWPAFSRLVGRSMRALWRVVRWLFVDLPWWIAQQPMVRALVRSRFVRAIFRFGIKPLLPVIVSAWLLPGRSRPVLRDGLIVGIYLTLNLLLNFSVGRRLEQAALYWVRVGWTRVAGNIFGGLFRLITWFFGRLIEDFDRMLYAVDEWLRFRAGQRKQALAAKAAAGVLWFYVAYVARFCINLLIEPQVNPIKHFPVVTVSHKICWLTDRADVAALEKLGLTTVRANTTTAVILTSIPGIFGFLAWEFKENWRLYRTNRPKMLRPVQVGHHGESVARLLRPGFHSGTIPKIFNRLRVAEKTGVRGAAHRRTEALDHVREATEQFLQREFIALLNQHPLWQATPVSLEHVRLGPTSILAELHCPAVGSAAAQVCFEQRAGWILASVSRPGWISRLSHPQARLLSVALLGLYKMAGVDCVAEQIEAQFASAPAAWEIRRKELVVWPNEGFYVESSYPWQDGPMPSRVDEGSAAPPGLPALDGTRVTLKHVQVEWAAWVRAWEPDPHGVRNHEAELVLGSLSVLPSDLVQRR